MRRKKNSSLINIVGGLLLAGNAYAAQPELEVVAGIPTDDGTTPITVQVKADPGEGIEQLTVTATDTSGAEHVIYDNPLGGLAAPAGIPISVGNIQGTLRQADNLNVQACATYETGTAPVCSSELGLVQYTPASAAAPDPTPGARRLAFSFADFTADMDPEQGKLVGGFEARLRTNTAITGYSLVAQRDASDGCGAMTTTLYSSDVRQEPDTRNRIRIGTSDDLVLPFGEGTYSLIVDIEDDGQQINSQDYVAPLTDETALAYFQGRMGEQPFSWGRWNTPKDIILAEEDQPNMLIAGNNYTGLFTPALEQCIVDESYGETLTVRGVHAEVDLDGSLVERMGGDSIRTDIVLSSGTGLELDKDRKEGKPDRYTLTVIVGGSDPTDAEDNQLTTEQIGTGVELRLNYVGQEQLARGLFRGSEVNELEVSGDGPKDTYVTLQESRVASGADVQVNYGATDRQGLEKVTATLYNPAGERIGTDDYTLWEKSGSDPITSIQETGTMTFDGNDVGNYRLAVTFYDNEGNTTTQSVDLNGQYAHEIVNIGIPAFELERGLVNPDGDLVGVQSTLFTGAPNNGKEGAYYGGVATGAMIPIGVGAWMLGSYVKDGNGGGPVTPPDTPEEGGPIPGTSGPGVGTR